jgi:hypothetical protein
VAVQGITVRAGGILNRVLFEDMASAHWIVANPALALERIQQHEQLEDILWRDIARLYPEMFSDIRPDRKADLQNVFGNFGNRHWTGLGMYALVQAIENQWPEGRFRNELWMYWRIGQRRNSSQVHGGAGPYADSLRHLFGGELQDAGVRWGGVRRRPPCERDLDRRSDPHPRPRPRRLIA